MFRFNILTYLIKNSFIIKKENVPCTFYHSKYSLYSTLFNVKSYPNVIFGVSGNIMSLDDQDFCFPFDFLRNDKVEGIKPFTFLTRLLSHKIRIIEFCKSYSFTKSYKIIRP